MLKSIIEEEYAESDKDLNMILGEPLIERALGVHVYPLMTSSTKFQVK